MKPFTTTLLLLALVSLVPLGLACAPTSGGNKVYYATGKGAVTPDGLHRVKWEPFEATFVKPGAKLGGYDSVILEEVTISYARPPHRYAMPGMSDGMDDNFALSSSATQHMKEYFQKAFAKELSGSDQFKVVEAPGPNVLRISGHIVNLQITAPPQSAMLNPDESVYTSSPGSMTLVLDADDSLTGEPLVRVGERSEIGDSMGQFYESNPVSNAGAVRQLFDNWARRLRQELDQFKSLPEIPTD